MSTLNAEYVEAMNEVLASNYYGEVLTVELISTLLGRTAVGAYRRILTRQLADETRHANLTRRLLLERGRDPLTSDEPTDFVFGHLFAEFAGREVDDVLAFLAENERTSSRQFSALIQVASAMNDDAVESLYGEILNDEVGHAHHLLASISGSSSVEREAFREHARQRMKKCLNLRYVRLFMGFKPETKGNAKRR